MATQFKHLDTRPTPAGIQSAPPAPRALPAVQRAVAELPAETQTATLDELNAGEDRALATPREAVDRMVANGARLLVTPGGKLREGASMTAAQMNDLVDRRAEIREVYRQFDATISDVPGAEAEIIAIIRADGIRCNNGCYYLEQAAPAPQVVA